MEYYAKKILQFCYLLMFRFVTRLQQEIIMASPQNSQPRSLPLSQFLALVAVQSYLLCNSYTECVEFIMDIMGLDEFTAVLCATYASIIYAAGITEPLRYVMTEIEEMQPDAEGNYPYSGYVDCAVQTFKAGGLFKFYTDFLLHWAEIFPIHLPACIFLEEVRQEWESVKH